MSEKTSPAIIAGAKVNKRAERGDRVVTVILYIIAIFFVLLLAAITIYILVKGIKAASPELLDFTGDGVGIQLFNTVYLVILSLIITVPIGVLTGIYMAEYIGKGPIVVIIRTCIETLSSLPSIIVGLFGFLVLIQLTGSHWNLIAGATALAILNVPLIARTTEDALRAIPQDYHDGSIGLGATRWQTIIHVSMKASTPRIITGVILAAGRGFGEAAALMFTSGMNSSVNFNDWNPLHITSPLNPLRSADTLAVHIWALKTQGIALNTNQIADLSAAALVILVFVFSLGSRWVSHHLSKKMLAAK